MSANIFNLKPIFYLSPFQSYEEGKQALRMEVEVTPRTRQMEMETNYDLGTFLPSFQLKVESYIVCKNNVDEEEQ